MKLNVYPVILAGGASSRLWPISDTQRPKWALRLFGGQSLLEQAWRRACLVAPAEHCYVAAGGAHEGLIRRSLNTLPEGNLLIEPALRDTAGAVAFTAGRVARDDPDGTLLVLPGDALISDVDRFAVCARKAIGVGQQEKSFVTFGLTPRYPATCYGYIHRGVPVVLSDDETGAPEAFRIQCFREKPEATTAVEYVGSGEYYWNGGIFVFPLRTLLSEFEANLPGHAAMVKALAATKSEADWNHVAQAHYPELKKISIDYGIMEKAKGTCTIVADFDWDDIGSWSAVHAHLPKENGNAVGPAVSLEAIDAQANLIYAPGRRVALIGVRDLAVVDDAEGLLICALDRDQEVKTLAQARPAVRKVELSASSQDRAIEVLLVEPETVGPETGFMLMLHGYGGSRRTLEKLMERWAARYNLVCVAPEYRDSGLDVDPERGYGVREPYDFSHKQLVDCLNAYQQARRRHLHADGRRAFVWGASQGGHLASLAAAMAPKTFALCVSVCGVSHITDSMRARMRGDGDEADLAIRDARRWAERIACQVVLMHGLADTVVLPSHTRALAAALASAGKNLSVRYIEGGDHLLGPITTFERLTESMADGFLKTLRREGRDDFETRGAYSFPCSGGVVFELDFSEGIARFARKG